MKRWIALLSCSLLASSAIAADKTLYFYNWSEYMPEEVLDQFEEETGITVKYTTYDSNESMYAKLRLLDAGNSYDLVIPSTYYVSKLIREGLLAPIDKSKLKHFDNLDSRLINQSFDQGNQYSVPYLWGTTGIAVNTDATDAKVTRWADLWKPEFQGRVVLTNDMREIFHIGLRVLGYSGNTTNPQEIEAAYNKLKELQPNVATYNSDAPRMPFIEGEADVGMIWNGECYQTREDLPGLTYIYPEEGVVVWMDNFVIPKNARNIDNAMAFIDFALRPEIAVKIAEAVGYTTPNSKALEMLPAEVRHNRTIHPSDADLKNSEFHTDVGDAIMIYEKWWEKLKAGDEP